MKKIVAALIIALFTIWAWADDLEDGFAEYEKKNYAVAI
jgi:hypothetical protein